ncbi:Sensor protein FixL [Saezia sanguinis]|uniref:histidine kinase n=1 Tax=Saezia sanguinis TaxID=1965230 RepID=A0A433SFW1_9BURK|nr:PAS domain-containing sensor histidine kinase [Saezia sanguinis]RUS67625.1 Sensor protein FixL [Saezia sanguinis]
MSDTPTDSPETATTPKPSNWLHWWTNLSSNKQDRIIALTPLLAVIIFFIVIMLTFWYLNNEERERELVTTRQSAETIQQQIRLRLIGNEDSLQSMATDISRTRDKAATLTDLAPVFMADHPEIIALYWHDLNAGQIYSYHLTENTAVPESVQHINAAGISSVQQNSSATSTIIRLPFFYSTPEILSPDTAATMNSSVLIPNNRHPQGILTATYDLDRLLRSQIPAEISLYSTIWFQGENDKILATTNPNARTLYERKHNQPPSYGVAIGPVGKQLMVYVQHIRASQTLAASVLFWFAVCLCFFIVTLLLLNWRHTHQRIKVQRAMQQETNFRRAMENSMVTGMRTLDMTGRITYVNPAFCRMTGYSEEALVGCMPPYPYWPQHNLDELHETIQDEISGTPLATGYEVQLQRRNGELFYARLYVSPLIDGQGHHTGWMTAVTDISEAKRIREELSLTGQRFTTVLEALDSAISVVAVGSQELLFANRSYRHLFGNDARGHFILAGEANRSAVIEEVAEDDGVDEFAGLPKEDLLDYSKKYNEIYVASINRWVEVRSRYLPWVDGRLAQMLIATDITERHRAQEQAAIQAARAQDANRLTTMGEMASSLAHELTQPLTAISNYCTGLISRIKQDILPQQDLIATLEKTSKQALRAGLVIQRIRSFVKKSDPNRTLSPIDDIIENVQELSEIDARRRNIQLHVEVDSDLPALVVDPILIEQVLLNLIRNATEAIEQAQRPPEQRRIDLQVKRSSDKGTIKAVEFSVSDTGTGIAPDTLEHMFEAFYTTKNNGLGIGLNLCRSIIESHGGRLRIENLYQQNQLTGCRFAFSLPTTQEYTAIQHDSILHSNLFTDEAP